ncbi:MAG: peptidoglycan-binding domain-containing protein [bacterium]
MTNSIRFSKVFGGMIAATVIVATCSPLLASAATLTRQLQQGMSGSDVSSLQTFLAVDPTIYPQGLVTGYFGTLTTSAVSNFQVRNNLPGVGRVGPATLVVINAQMAGGVSTGTDIDAPTFLAINANLSKNSAIMSWTNNEPTRGIVFYSTSPLTLGEHAYTVDVSGTTAMSDADLHGTQSIALTGLATNTTYYYSLKSVDASGNVSITWPATFQTTN